MKAYSWESEGLQEAVAPRMMMVIMYVCSVSMFHVFTMFCPVSSSEKAHQRSWEAPSCFYICSWQCNKGYKGNVKKKYFDKAQLSLII